MNGFAVTEFRRGEPLFVKGNPAREMYFIVTGTVELVDGHTVEKLSTGGVVGAVEFLRQEPYKTSALCVNDTSVLVLNEENLPEFFQRQPQLGFILLKAVAAYIPSSVERRGQAQAAPQRQLHQSLRELLLLAIRKAMPRVGKRWGVFVYQNGAVPSMPSLVFHAQHQRIAPHDRENLP